jgi:hypothetical protein
MGSYMGERRRRLVLRRACLQPYMEVRESANLMQLSVDWTAELDSNVPSTRLSVCGRDARLEDADRCNDGYSCVQPPRRRQPSALGG